MAQILNMAHEKKHTMSESSHFNGELDTKDWKHKIMLLSTVVRLLVAPRGQ